MGLNVVYCLRNHQKALIQIGCTSRRDRATLEPLLLHASTTYQDIDDPDRFWASFSSNCLVGQNTDCGHWLYNIVVGLDYVLKLEGGEVIDSSDGQTPLEFLQGHGEIIAGLEQALYGMAVGDKKSIRIEAADAYGERHEQLVQQVPRSALPEGMTPEEGMALQSQSPDGQVMMLMITAVGEEEITVDANHPLAGQALSFDIELVSIGGDVGLIIPGQ